MTNEKKQALIAKCKKDTAEMKSWRDGDDYSLDIAIFEIALAALTAQPIGRVDRGAATDSNEYPDARVVCLHEYVGWEAFQDGCELFTRPAPAVSLAELVLDEDDNPLGFTAWYERHFATQPYKGASHVADCENAWRAAILRNIEEAK